VIWIETGTRSSSKSKVSFVTGLAFLYLGFVDEGVGVLCLGLDAIGDGVVAEGDNRMDRDGGCDETEPASDIR